MPAFRTGEALGESLSHDRNETTRNSWTPGNPSRCRSIPWCKVLTDFRRQGERILQEESNLECFREIGIERRDTSPPGDSGKPGYGTVTGGVPFQVCVRDSLV